MCQLRFLRVKRSKYICFKPSPFFISCTNRYDFRVKLRIFIRRRVWGVTRVILISLKCTRRVRFIPFVDRPASVFTQYAQRRDTCNDGVFGWFICYIWRFESNRRRTWPGAQQTHASSFDVIKCAVFTRFLNPTRLEKPCANPFELRLPVWAQKRSRAC